MSLDGAAKVVAVSVEIDLGASTRSIGTPRSLSPQAALCKRSEIGCIVETSVTSGKDLVLALLYLKGASGKEFEPIRGITRIEKLVYLSKNYESLKPIFNRLAYKADNYGPFSDKLQDDLETLRTVGLIEVRQIPLGSDTLADEFVAEAAPGSSPLPKTMDEYSLTEVGRLVAQQLVQSADPNQVRSLEEIKGRFNGVPLGSLLGFVYTTADPSYLEKSKIRSRFLA